MFMIRRIEHMLRNSKIMNKQYAHNSNLKPHQEELMKRGLPKVKPIPGVKNTILVSSGKGGVGKSTTAVNLAAALKTYNFNIGLLDTDVFGPSVPLMMNLSDTPFLNKDNLMEPLTNYGIKCMSMGFLIAEDSPVIWRGLMVMQALDKLLKQVYWGNIDYLIIDTPPGTGDTHLSIIQNIPITGTILVTTPQSASIQVTRRSAVMFQKLNVPIIGLVENMSHVTCTSCSKNIRLFGDGTEKFSKDFGIDIIEKLPLEEDISNATDVGIPIVLDKPNSSQTKAYVNLAKYVIDFCK